MATDADTGDTVSYVLEGTDAGSFAIGASDGVLKTKAALDYETKTSYAVTASDQHGNAASLAVTITVTNVDEAGTVSFDSTAPAVGRALTASLEDPDESVSSVTWQWAKAATQSGAYADIAGATAAAYTPEAGDAGAWLRATARYADGEGSGKSAEASAAAAVAATDTTRPTVIAASTGYYGDAALTTALTGPLRAGADVYTKVTFSEDMKQVASDAAAARPELFYRIGTTDTRYDVLAAGGTLASGDCKPNHATETDEYVCLYTVGTSDNGAFAVKAGTNSVDKADNALASVYEHAILTISLTVEDRDPKAWLARFGRTAASQALEAVTARLEGGGGSHLTLGGHQVSLSASPGGAAEDARDRQAWDRQAWLRGEESAGGMRAVTGRELLLGSSFHVESGGAAEGPAFAALGRVAHGSFAGESGGERDGEVTTAFLGADVVGWGWLAGAAVSVSRGALDGGRVGSELTSVLPYARVAFGERLSAWALAGVGVGELTLTERSAADRITAERSYYRADLRTMMGGRARAGRWRRAAASRSGSARTRSGCAPHRTPRRACGRRRWTRSGCGSPWTRRGRSRSAAACSRRSCRWACAATTATRRPGSAWRWGPTSATRWPG